MDIGELLWQGLVVMLLGMGSVFVFLGLLILLIHLIARLVPAESELANAPATLPRPAGAATDATLVALISAAIARYRAEHSPADEAKSSPPHP